MQTYLIGINEFKKDYIERFCEWKKDAYYENGKKVFYLVEAETENDAKRKLVKQLIPTWNDSYTEETVFNINDEAINNYEFMDRELFGDDFTIFTSIFEQHRKYMTNEQFTTVFPDNLKLKLYQDYEMRKYYAFNYTKL